MARSVAFYRDVVGMPLRFETEHWTEFNTEGATWALHKTDSPPKTGSGADLESAGSCRPGFQVPDLDSFHARMAEANAVCVQEPSLVFGARIAQYQDPDGLVFSVSQAR
jgi:lactoylglutathione lyase